MREPVHTETHEIGDSEYRISIYQDEDAVNPMDEWSEMGTITSIYSDNRFAWSEHSEATLEAFLNENHDAVALSFPEVWEPDKETIASAKNLGGRTRRLFMEKRAKQAWEVYRQWQEGDVYGYVVEKITECDKCGNETSEEVDSCWAFCGLYYCIQSAREALPEASRTVTA